MSNIIKQDGVLFYPDRESIKTFALYNIPRYIQQDYPLFVKLLEHFYDFMEQEDNVLDGYEHYNEHTSVVSPYNKFWDRIYEDAGFNFSADLMIDKRQFYNYLMDFYMYRGSLQGLKFLIATLYDEDVKVEYPRESMLIPSQAEYDYNQYIVFKPNSIDGNFYRRFLEYLKFFDVTVKSNTTNDTLNVENIYSYVRDGDIYLNLKVNYKKKNTFLPGEQLTLFTSDFSILGVNAPLVMVNIDKGGIGYEIGDVIELQNVVTTGSIRVKKIGGGSIKSVNISNWGEDYQVGDYIVAARNNKDSIGSGFYAEVSRVSPTGQILNVEIHSHGNNYKQIPELIIYSKTGKNAQIQVGQVEDIGAIEELEYVENAVIDTLKHLPENIVYTIKSDKGQNAELSFSTTAVNYTTSFHRDAIGFLDNKSYLIDSLYYQQYCYKIVSKVPREVYDPVVDVMSHPSGYMRYASFRVIDNKIKLSNKQTKATFYRGTI